MGWGVVEGPDYRLIASGIHGITRYPGETYKEFRPRAMEYWMTVFESFRQHNADLWVFELVPMVGGKGFVNPDTEMVKIGIVVLEVLCKIHGQRYIEFAANTVKDKLTNDGLASKVKVRNVVLDVFPELLPRKKELTNPADESDGIGIALVGAGYDVSKRKR